MEIIMHVAETPVAMGGIDHQRALEDVMRALLANHVL
jgi:hypothetical protein